MRTPVSSSTAPRGPLEQQPPIGEEDESAASHQTDDEQATSSSFSLRECVKEFRARREHRSSHSNQTDDDLVNQNKSNKQNERNAKPCKNGFCYCFTSDSDDFRLRKSDGKRKSRRSETTEEQISDMSNNKNKVRRRETFPLHSKRQHDIHQQNGLARKVTAVSKLHDSSRNSKAPLIHIVQEIRNNYVVSEVHVNKQKISQRSSAGKKSSGARQKVDKIQKESTNPKEHTSNLADHISEIDSLVEVFHLSSLNTSSKCSDRNGGRLLQKRLSGAKLDYKPRNLSAPPRKPPRNLQTTNSDRSSQSTAPSIKEAEKILDDFLQQKGISLPRHSSTKKNNRKSFPLPKSISPVFEQQIAYQKPIPSCPSLSDIIRLDAGKSIDNLEFVPRQVSGSECPKIREMLQADVNSKNFKFNNSPCGPQVGWRAPQKLDIDTVDGSYHNLVANMESKCTPVKADVFNDANESQKFILAEQFKNFVTNSPWSSKKAKNKENVKKSTSLMNMSKTKLLRFVTKKSPRKYRSIGVQTMGTAVTHQVECEKQKRFSLQSPPGSYFSTTPAKSSKGSQTQFDFGRKVNSPKTDNSTQRKLLFPTVNALKETSRNKTNLNKIQNQTYQSYNSDLDKDLTLSKMGQVLSNIRHRLEVNDDYAVKTFCDIRRKEAAVAAANESLSYDCVDGFDFQRLNHMSAKADVHQEAEPSYSEIEEERFYVRGSPVTENTNNIEHFILDHDPSAIYAVVNKTPKKQQSHESSFNNVMEQNSPPKLRNVSKTDLSVQSEIFLENLTSENRASPNHSFEKEEKAMNSGKEVSYYNEWKNRDNSYASVESFRENLAKESDAVSYELPEDNSNPINVEDVSGNQSTPKKTIHLSKYNMELSSHDLHQTSSCPATPGWAEVNQQDFQLMDESMSLQEEPTTNSRKSTNLSLWKYGTLKDKLRSSIRKSRHFFKNEGKRISNTFQPLKPLVFSQPREVWDESSLCITNLFSMDDSAPVSDQLSQAVSICRLVPELEASAEMVEAERLLLFTELKKDTKNADTSLSYDSKPNGAITIKSIRLPIKVDYQHGLFFNYHYIVVFTCGRQVKSTQSAECLNGELIFRNCNLNFENVGYESEVRCDVFMLRLRKVITTKKVPPKPKRFPLTPTSSEEILSRFRPQASFVIRPADFAPYHLAEDCPKTSEESSCLHADNNCVSPVIPRVKSTYLLNEAYISGEMELSYRRQLKQGFLNVQDADKKHNWNLRWCELNIFKLNIWNCPNDVPFVDPVHTIDLCKCITFPVKCAQKEICARPRSFSLEFDIAGSNCINLFSADNQNDLNYWISALNEVLEFIQTWMR